jgi:hypothetical protein
MERYRQTTYRKGICLLLSLLGLYLQPCSATQPQTFRISTNDVSRDYPRDVMLAEALVRAALQDNQITLELVFMPATRALVQANSGIVDGVMLRAENLAGDSTGTLAVPEPVCQIDYFLYAQPHRVSSNYWRDLSNPRLITLPIMRELHSRLPASLYSQQAPVTVQGVHQGIRTLQEGRGNVLLMADGLVEISQQTQEDMPEAVKLQPAVASQPGLLWLHQRHQASIPAIAASLRQLKDRYRQAHGLAADAEINCTATLPPGFFNSAAPVSHRAD